MNSNFFSPLPRYDDGDEGNSQSLSQVHPRCAIRLDTQPYLGSQSHPNSLTRSSPTPFAVRDVNAVHTNTAKALSRTHESLSEPEYISHMTSTTTSVHNTSATAAEAMSHFTLPNTSSFPPHSNKDDDDDEEDEDETSNMTAPRSALLQPVMPEEHTVLQYLPSATATNTKCEEEDVTGQCTIASLGSRLASPDPRAVVPTEEEEEIPQGETVTRVNVNDAVHEDEGDVCDDAPLPHTCMTRDGYEDDAQMPPSRSATSHSPPRRRTFVLSRVPSDLVEQEEMKDNKEVQCERDAVRRSFTNGQDSHDSPASTCSDKKHNETHNAEEVATDMQTLQPVQDERHEATPVKVDARGSIILDFSPVTQLNSTTTTTAAVGQSQKALQVHYVTRAAHEVTNAGRVIEEGGSAEAARSVSSEASAQDSLLSPMPRPVWRVHPEEQENNMVAHMEAAEDVLLSFRTTSELQNDIDVEKDVAPLPHSTKDIHHYYEREQVHEVAHAAVAEHALPDSMWLVKGTTPTPLRHSNQPSHEHTATHHYEQDNVHASHHALQREGSTGGLDTPSSARVSSEVRQLVERAQEEVRRTRESLLATLHTSNTTTTSHTAMGGLDDSVSGIMAEEAVHSVQTISHADNVSNNNTNTSAAVDTLTPPLTLQADPHTVETVAQERYTGEHTVVTNKTLGESARKADAFTSHPSTVPHAIKEANTNNNTSGGPALSATPAAATRLSWCDEAQLLRKSASEAGTAALRAQLSACADRIARRLRGYDASETNVLPMETVLRVVQFVLQQQVEEEGEGNDTIEKGEGEESNTARLLTSTPCRTTDSTMLLLSHNLKASMSGGSPSVLQLTPRAHPALLAQHRSAFSSPPRLSARTSTNLLTTTSDSPSWLNVAAGRPMTRPPAPATHESHKRSRSPRDETTNAGVVEEETSAMKKSNSLCGRPATCISPTRTLEYVMARQAARAAEEDLLSLYCKILRLFREVYGERYAWHHLGATEATKQDGTRARHAAQHHDRIVGDALESTMDMPLETMFPRLRQHYGATLLESTNNTSLGSATQWPGRSGAAPDILRYPPPLDMLIYYPVFVESLREL